MMLSGISQVSTWTHVWRCPNLSPDPLKHSPWHRSVGASITRPLTGLCPAGSAQCSFHPLVGIQPETWENVHHPPLSQPLDTTMGTAARFSSFKTLKIRFKTRWKSMNWEPFYSLNRNTWHSSSPSWVGRADISTRDTYCCNIPTNKNHSKGRIQKLCLGFLPLAICQI